MHVLFGRLSLLPLNAKRLFLRISARTIALLLNAGEGLPVNQILRGPACLATGEPFTNDVVGAPVLTPPKYIIPSHQILHSNRACEAGDTTIPHVASIVTSAGASALRFDSMPPRSSSMTLLRSHTQPKPLRFSLFRQSKYFTESGIHFFETYNSLPDLGEAL
jgi:hypothetical protein